MWALRRLEYAWKEKFPRLKKTKPEKYIHQAQEYKQSDLNEKILHSYKKENASWQHIR